MIALPPLLAGAVQLTVAWAVPATALTLVGDPGAVGALGVTELDGDEGLLVPIALVAVTVRV